MKKLLTLFALALVVVVSSCSQFDDTPIWDKLNEQEQTLNDHERRIAALEELCKQMNTNIQALKTLVEAFEKRDYVTDVLPISEDGEVVGYTISFASSDTITIYMGKDGEDGEDGADGKDGYTPQIGVMKDTDGIYYWTIDGEWLLDDNGNKIKAIGEDGEDGKDGQDGADGTNGSNGNNGQNGQDGEDGEDGKDGITPRLKIENDYWYVSYDEGTTWIELGKATGEDGKSIQIGNSFIDNISLSEKGLIFVLDSGFSFTIPYYYEHLRLTLWADLHVMEPNSTLDIHYLVTRVGTDSPVIVEVVSSADIKAKVIPETGPYKEKVTGVIQVNTGDKIDEYSKVIVFATDGLDVVMRSIRFEEPGLVVEENTTKHVPSEGGEIALEFLSNVECEAVIPEDAQDWISVVPATRMEKQTITLKLEPNAGDSRTAEVQVKSTDGKLSLTYTISQEPNSDYLLALEREALIAIYNALDGDNWINNENWCSDKPVSEWFGLHTHDDGTIRGFQLQDNLLSGEMPDDLFKLKNLKLLNISNNNISTIPTGISSLTKLTLLHLPFLANIPIDELYNLSEITELGLCVSDENLPSTGIDLSRWENLYRATISANQDDCIPLPNDFSGLSNLRYLILNGFSGELSPTIGQCTGLVSLVIQNGTVTGEIPSTIGNLKKLSQLILNNNQFSGSIPGEIFSCPLTYIRLENNRLSGEIPEEFGNWLSSMQDSLMSTGSWFDCVLHHNNLSGVPESIQKHPMWKVVWPHIITQNDINHKDILLPGSHLSGCDIDGCEINSDTDYAKYDYTVLWQIPPATAVNSMVLFNVYQMNNIYEKYKDSNVKFIYLGAPWNTEEELRNFRNNYDVKWQTFNVNSNALRNLRINFGHSTSYMDLQVDSGGVRGNQVTIVDNSGNIVYSSVLDGEDLDQLNSYLEKILGAGSDIYQSTDYSADGAVVTLQTATQGEGIDIVLMGDAYSDRQIADGTYEADMKYVYKNLFTEEPYKSFKDYFNVRYVNVVSATEGYKNGDTALDSYFGGGTLVGGDDSAVFNYALKAISEEQMDEALLIVVMNSDIYAGTCYMYYPDNTADFGNGVSVSYFPKGGDETTFAQLLHHEACGHGFAKLADEYAYEEYGAIPSGYASQIQEQQSNWGWWKNVDFTSDPTATRWSHFINDTRYANEGLGAYEGGLTYWTGVWRPTDNSIMRYNTGGFNAPSREAIYYRIHKLAYGADWEYDYEEFVEWDARNRATAATRAMVYKPTNYKPTHPPVIVNKSWKDAK